MVISRKVLCIMIIGAFLTNLIVFFVVSAVYQEKIDQLQIKPENQEEYVRINQIKQEMEEESIKSTDRQNAYDQIINLPDKSFVYDLKNIVIVRNQEVCFNDFEVPLDVNQYYQDIIEKFIRLCEEFDNIVSTDALVSAGFIPEVEVYGIKNVYPDWQQDYKALSRYYMYKRLSLELEIERFIDDKSSAEEVENKYNEYKTSKKLLNDYINSITLGDL